MGHLAKFVDSIAASPTVRLDLNDETTWTCTRFDPGVPTIRRAMSSNAMTDGVHVSSSSYDARTITFDLLLRTSTQDLNATQIQTLARELDRATNIVMYQPNGLTKPVFFKTFRSNLSQIQDILTATAMRTCTIELLAEPFALGLMETISVGTVNNDPAHATNGCYFDLTTVIGDVAAPCVIVDTVAAATAGYWAVKQTGTPTDMVHFYQADTGWSLIGFANPGGGPDAAMSGTGTNNYIRSSISTPELSRTITGTDAERRARAGAWRVLVCVRPSNTDPWSVRMLPNEAYTDIDLGAARRLVDLGVFDFGGNITPGQNSATTAPAGDFTFDIRFVRASGSGTIDVDYIQLIPADRALGVYDMIYDPASYDHVFDGPNEVALNVETAGSLTAGTTSTSKDLGVVAGGFISLVPNQTNRVYWIKYNTYLTYDFAKADTSSLTVYYWPRYIFIRPSAT